MYHVRPILAALALALLAGCAAGLADAPVPTPAARQEKYGP
jgi:hypothetical protein